MSQRQKFLAQLLAARNASTLSFLTLCSLLRAMGFAERVRGSHHIYTKEGVEEIINLQPAPGGTVKPYQAKQVREILIRYQLTDHGQDDPES
ncbi:type II toxin-antitoxin system HicA family toxin [Hymenobacter sp.]|uniref:type II toxin-antitoxin system HicA family toxin n=1 Tax=Hymenobacter sp. TaxID=1898978 RepID=UPI00286C8C24|nr:type II toxin-antitoxin system HicA family toxin [Hymenobacter sp.]